MSETIKRTIEVQHYNTSATIDLSIYEGFATLEDLVRFMTNHDIEKHLYVVVKFLAMYYAVIYQDISKEIMIGKDEYWYRKDSLMHKRETKTFQYPYSTKNLNKSIRFTDQIAKDLSSLGIPSLMC